MSVSLHKCRNKLRGIETEILKLLYIRKTDVKISQLHFVNSCKWNSAPVNINLIYLYLSIVDRVYEIDKHIMYLILTRIFTGNDIAKIKYEKNKSIYLKTKNESDIMKLLTNTTVEKQILENIKKKPGKQKIIQQMYDITSKILIPYTKIVEVKYIQQRIKTENKQKPLRSMQLIK